MDLNVSHVNALNCYVVSHLSKGNDNQSVTLQVWMHCVAARS